MIASGLARTPIYDRINRIRRVFRWAASVELIPVAVVQALGTVSGLQKGRTKAREPKPIGQVILEVVGITLPYLPGRSLMVRLQLLTGMRPGEACAMRGRGRELTQAGDDRVYRPQSHKTVWRGKLREIPLGPKAIEIIRGFLKSNPDAHIFSPAKAVAERHAKLAGCRATNQTPIKKTGPLPTLTPVMQRGIDETLISACWFELATRPFPIHHSRPSSRVN